jgi:hypothetical protein
MYFGIVADTSTYSLQMCLKARVRPAQVSPYAVVYSLFRRLRHPADLWIYIRCQRTVYSLDMNLSVCGSSLLTHER